MPSSSPARRSIGLGSRTLEAVLATILLMASVAGVTLLRPALASSYHRLRVTGDLYTLPSPEQTVVLSLGYRAALADMLYANALVEHGLHFQEKRRFEFVGQYLETINELDPKFRSPYMFADTLLTLQPGGAPWSHYVMARRILERGMRERPFDTELWLQAGQFLAYLAGGQTEDPEVRREWSLAGARALARACEIVGRDANIPYHCITAAHILSRRGQNEAMLRWLERVIAVNDDENLRRLALGYLKAKIGEREQRRAADRLARFERAWREDLGFVSKNTILVLGPAFDPRQCAGIAASRRTECAASWRDWFERTSPDEVTP